jgi:hypothetical protein
VQTGGSLSGFTGAKAETRQAVAAGSMAWGTAGPQTDLTMARFDSYTLQTPTGSLAVANTPATFSRTSEFFGTPVSSTTGTRNARGEAATSGQTGLGSPPVSARSTGSGQQDPQGRIKGVTVTGRRPGSAEYGADSWFGPDSVTAPGTAP